MIIVLTFYYVLSLLTTTLCIKLVEPDLVLSWDKCANSVLRNDSLLQVAYFSPRKATVGIAWFPPIVTSSAIPAPCLLLLWHKRASFLGDARAYRIPSLSLDADDLHRREDLSFFPCPSMYHLPTPLFGKDV